MNNANDPKPPAELPPEQNDDRPAAGAAAPVAPAEAYRPTGERRVSLFWKILIAFLLLAVLPMAITVVVVGVEVNDLRDQADRVSFTYERRAARIATRVSDLLAQCEADLKALARLAPTDANFTAFVESHKRPIWIRSGTNNQPGEARLEVPLYKEASFVDPQGQEQVLIVRGTALPADRHRNVADPAQTTYRSERYFLEANALPAGELYVSHLTGFHLNKIEALGVEKILPTLQRKSSQDKLIYRFLLYEILRAAGEVEFVDSFTEGPATIMVYRIPGEDARILVEAPQARLEELQARELELKEFIGKLAPEDAVEGATYDGVIRFAMPVFDPDGKRRGVVVLALDHLHLQQLTQHIKAMEENVTVFAGYRDADYTYLFDDEGWTITHPKHWNIRGLDRRGQPIAPITERSSRSEDLVGRTPVSLLNMDWKMGEGYHAVVLETQAGRTGIATSKNLSDILRTRVYSPIFYATGSYAKFGIFGGVLMGTRVDKFVELMRKQSEQIGGKTTEVRQILLVILGGILALISVLSVVMARRLVRPLRALAEAARKVGGGDLEASVPIGSRDEIGELAVSFRDMTHSLKATIGQLESRNVELKKAQQRLLKAEKDKRAELQREVDELQKEVARSSFSSMIADSPPMKKILEEIVRISKSSATVLILGENGTGKELVAEAIHKNSPRREKAFVRINCAAFNDNLLESELFGHLKGAYTGAIANRKGLFEAADQGTILLDEIGDMSLEMQKKFLRTLQEGEVVPVGSSQVVKVDVRIIAATNKDLQQLMKDGRFREDLFHRINVIAIKIPPLRERREDILSLARHFARTLGEREGKPEMVLDPSAETFLTEYRWPGNVRELENAIERAVIRSQRTTLLPEDFQLAMEEKDLPPVLDGIEKGLTLEEVEKAYILSVLEKNGGNKKQTATELGIGYNTLWRKLKQYNRL